MKTEKYLIDKNLAADGYVFSFQIPRASKFFGVFVDNDDAYLFYLVPPGTVNQQRTFILGNDTHDFGSQYVEFRGRYTLSSPSQTFNVFECY